MQKERFYSLDVFRGATVALMIMVNNPGSWEHIYAPLDHAEWNGCTPTDLVFPFFLFAVGNAMSFVMPRLRAAGNAAFFKKTVRRTVLIFAIGLFLNWSPFVKWDDAGHLIFKAWHNVRILGVLQRIAISYFLASLIVYFCKPKAAYILCGIILLLYWAVCYYGGALGDPYSLQGWFGTSIDKAILGESHMYHGEGIAFDPEGLASGLTPVVQVVLGYFVGKYIQAKGKTYEMVTNLFVASAFLLLAALAWDMVFPFNKKIWTSSYVLYTTGLATLILSTIIFLIEFKGQKGWLARFFDVFGKNPLFIFFLSGFLPRLLGLIRFPGFDAMGLPAFDTPFSWFYKHVCQPVFADERNSSLLYALINISFYWLIVYILDKKKIYIKV